MSGPLDRYLSRVQQSMTLRHTAAFPEIAGLVVICVTAVASYIVLSLWLVPADLPREWRFRSETGSVTALSGVFLVAGAACAFVSFLRYPRLAEVFAIAFFFYLVHTFVDATQDPPTTYSVILEEPSCLAPPAWRSGLSLGQ